MFVVCCFCLFLFLLSWCVLQMMLLRFPGIDVTQVWKLILTIVLCERQREWLLLLILYFVFLYFCIILLRKANVSANTPLVMLLKIYIYIYSFVQELWIYTYILITRISHDWFFFPVLLLALFLSKFLFAQRRTFIGHFHSSLVEGEKKEKKKKREC